MVPARTGRQGRTLRNSGRSGCRRRGHPGLSTPPGPKPDAPSGSASFRGVHRHQVDDHPRSHVQGGIRRIGFRSASDRRRNGHRRRPASVSKRSSRSEVHSRIGCSPRSKRTCTDSRLSVNPVREAVSLGAALLAGLGCGVFADASAAVRLLAEKRSASNRSGALQTAADALPRSLPRPLWATSNGASSSKRFGSVRDFARLALKSSCSRDPSNTRSMLTPETNDYSTQRSKSQSTRSKNSGSKV